MHLLSIQDVLDTWEGVEALQLSVTLTYTLLARVRGGAAASAALLPWPLAGVPGGPAVSWGHGVTQGS